MTAEVIESQRKKCEKYWPDQVKRLDYWEDISVELSEPETRVRMFPNCLF